MAAAAAVAAAADPSPSHPSPDASPFHDSVPPYMAAVAAYAPRAAPPWLFIPSGRNTEVHAINCFNNSSTPEIYRIRLPKHLHGYRLICSIGHRLLYEKPGSLSGIRLFNPFSSSTQDALLPPSATLAPYFDSFVPPPGTTPRTLGRMYFHYQIHTVIADTDSGFAVALMDRLVCRLAYTNLHCTDDNPVNCNPGDRWINITDIIEDESDDDYFSFRSAALYKKGFFCLVEFTGRKVFALQLSDRAPPALSDITFNLDNHYSPPLDEAEWCCYQSVSLVNSRGSIYLVRWRNTLNRDGVKYKRDIDIHKLYLDANMWAPVTTLDDHSFFIGHTKQSFSVSTADFPGLKSNCVYLSLDATTPIAGDAFNCPYDHHDRDELGLHLVYSLEDKIWGVFYHNVHPRFSLWMIPDANQALRDAELPKSHQKKLDS